MADLMVGDIRVGKIEVEFEASPPEGVTLEQLRETLIGKGYEILEMRVERNTILIGKVD